jgi:hypothetical protein
MHYTAGVQPSIAPLLPKAVQSLTFGKTWRPGQLKEVRELRKALTGYSLQTGKPIIDTQRLQLQEERRLVQEALNQYQKEQGDKGKEYYELAILYQRNPLIRKHPDLLKPLVQEMAQSINSLERVYWAIDFLDNTLAISLRELLSQPARTFKSLLHKERPPLFLPQVFLEPLLARKRELERQQIVQWPQAPEENDASSEEASSESENMPPSL